MADAKDKEVPVGTTTPNATVGKEETPKPTTAVVTDSGKGHTTSEKVFTGTTDDENPEFKKTADLGGELDAVQTVDLRALEDVPTEDEIRRVTEYLKNKGESTLEKEKEEIFLENLDEALDKVNQSGLDLNRQELKTILTLCKENILNIHTIKAVENAKDVYIVFTHNAKKLRVNLNDKTVYDYKS